MPLANYTTSVPVNRTIAEMTDMLAKAGANAVMTEFSGGLPEGLAFRLMVGGLEMGFKLPCDWRAALKVIQKDPSMPRSKVTPEHAQRMAWRILRDALRAQLAQVEIGSAKVEQIMLPYAVTPTGETVYERFEQSKFNQLTWSAPT